MASRSLVSHAIETNLSTSFVPGRKAKWLWQWKSEIGWTLHLRLSNGAKTWRVSLLGTCNTGRQREVQGAGKESAGLRVFPIIGLADAPTLREPLQALAESWPLRPR
jgi:hypothetical protein